MKKILSVLLAVILLAGCSILPRDTVPPESTLPSLPEPDLLDRSIAADLSGTLRKIQNKALEEIPYCAEFKIWKDCLLIAFSRDFVPQQDGGTGVYTLIMVDVRTGQLRATADVQVKETLKLQLCGDTVAVHSWGDGRICMLDGNLQETARYQAAEGWAISYVDPGGRFACVSPEAGGLQRVALESGRTVPVLEGMKNLYVSGQQGDWVTVSYLDPATEQFCRAAVQISTGQVREFPFGGAGSGAQYAEGLWLAPVEGTFDHYLIGRDENPVRAVSPGPVFELVAGPAPLCAVSYENNTAQIIRFYREDGTLFCRCTYESDGAGLEDPVWSEARQGYFFHSITPEGKTEILFCDAAGPFEEETLEQYPGKKQELPREALSEELYNRAEALSVRYGVEIRIGDQCSTEYSGFTAARELKETVIYRGLDSLETALSAYPAGFLRQLLYGGYRTVEINLTGAVTASDIPADANGFTQFAAFVEHTGDRHRMILDINQIQLEQTIYHEFSHIIDSRLEFHARYFPSMYSEEAWAALNPADFTYADSVYILPETSRSDGYNGYFTDLYARTRPTEDRARVMENAMAGNVWLFDGDFYEPMRKKLEFYAAAIREGFRTEGWPAVTSWEAPLQ